MTAKLLLVDGHNLLFQMFFGMPARITGKDGQDIRNVLGFVGALLKIARMTGPSHMLVVFDSEDAGDRREQDADYKANRPDYRNAPDDANPFMQLPWIFQALEHAGIKYHEAKGCECDDLIAAYALAYRTQAEIVIASHDSDFYQLIDDKVRVLRYRGKVTQIMDKTAVWKKFGVDSAHFADFKALIGDNADNIAGVKSVGPKMAAMLLEAYGTIEDIIANTANITRSALQKAIAANHDKIRHNLTLIKLNGNVPLPYAKDALQINAATLPQTTVILKAIGLR